MKNMYDDASPPALRIVTDDMVRQAALGVDAEEMAIARRLVNDPRLGITRVTIVGLGGTYVVEPVSIRSHSPRRVEADADSSARRGGWLTALRSRLREQANS